MINVVIPEKTDRRLPFYLAAEEWVAHNLPADEYFFAWRVNPTVICGRHQEIDKEVNLDYCNSHQIDVVRRRSGGGCVFADRNNWMFSYITPGDAIVSTFSHYTGMIASMLTDLGFDAAPTGRNDILVNGSKVAGNAFYHIPGRCIVHGTMLLDIDHEHISNAITPARAKLESKGVKSVSSRVTSLRASGLSMSVEEFGSHVVNSLCDKAITLSETDVAQIEELEKRYYAPDFLRIGCLPQKGNRRQKHIEGVGSVCANIITSDFGTIQSVKLTGDFFADDDAVRNFENSLKGLLPEQIDKHILSTGSPIIGLDAHDLAKTFTE